MKHVCRASNLLAMASNLKARSLEKETNENIQIKEMQKRKEGTATVSVIVLSNLSLPTKALLLGDGIAVMPGPTQSNKRRSWHLRSKLIVI